MKVSMAMLVAVVFTCTQVLGQESACGPKEFRGKVETKDVSSPPLTEGSKATIVFIEDQLVARPGTAHCLKCGVPLLFGENGHWIAGTQGFTHTQVQVAPGEHHFCSQVFLGGDYLPAMYGVRLEGGKTYYIVAKLSIAIGARSDILELLQPNDDEGKFLFSVTGEVGLVQK